MKNNPKLIRYIIIEQDFGGSFVFGTVGVLIITGVPVNHFTQYRAARALLDSMDLFFCVQIYDLQRIPPILPKHEQ